MKKLTFLITMMLFWFSFSIARAANAYEAPPYKDTTSASAKSTHKKIVKHKKKLFPFYIEIIGQNPVTVMKGSVYVDPGAIAHGPRDVDGPIKLVAINMIDTSKIGMFTIVYTKTTRNNEVLKESRTIIVVEAKVSPTASPTPSPTKLVKEKSVDRKFSDRWFQFSWEQVAASFGSQSEDPQGFSTTSSSNVGQKFSVEGIIAGKVGLMVSHDSGNTSLEKKVYGASIGTVGITDSWELMAKVYPVKDEHWLPYAGLGVKFAGIDNKLMIGGTPFPHTDTASSIVFELGSIFPITDGFGFTFSGELYKLGSVTSIPFTVDTSTFAEFSVNAGLVIRP